MRTHVFCAYFSTYIYPAVAHCAPLRGSFYLSVIRDLFDNSIVAYQAGTEQTENLVLNNIKAAKEKEMVSAELQLHTDQGFQYTSS